MNQLLYIVWNPDLVAFRLGPLSVRWYGLMWSIGIVLAFLVVKRLYKEQKIKDELFAPLYIYCFFGILIGARLGHCIFYQPQNFLTSGKGIIEMLLPIHFRLEADRLCRTSLAWRNAGTHDSPVALCPQDKAECLDGARQYRHRYRYHSLLYPFG